METKLSDLKFKMNQTMINYFEIISFLNNELNSLDNNDDNYNDLKKDIEKYKLLFIKEFQLINKNEIATFERIKNES